MGRTSDAPLKLQEAFISLIWGQCYSHVTIDAVCAEAGVKKGSFYYFYKSKAELALDAFHYHWEEETRPDLDDIFSASRTPTERIQILLERDLEMAMEQQATEGKILGCPFCNVAQEISTLDPDLASRINEKIECFKSYIASAMRDAMAEASSPITDPEQTAFAIYNHLHGSYAQARIQNSLDPLLHLPESINQLSGLQLKSHRIAEKV